MPHSMPHITPHRARALPLLPALLLAMLLGALLAPSWARPPGVEPPKVVRVTLAGEEHLIAEGEETVVQVGTQKIPVQVEVLDVRIFDNAGGLRFAYPADVEFSYVKEGEDPTWTLTGRGYYLSLQRIEGQVVKAERRVEIMLDVWRRHYPKTLISEDVEFVLGGRTLKAIRREEPEAPGRVDTFVGFDTEDAVYLLTIYQKVDAAGDTPRESEEALRLLAEEFHFPGA